MKLNCECCKKEFHARAADRKRGWARFCSKSCKAKEQEKRTGQYRRYRHNQEFCTLLDGEEFFAASFDNTEHQNND